MLLREDFINTIASWELLKIARREEFPQFQAKSKFEATTSGVFH